MAPEVVLASCAGLPAGDGDDDALLDALRAAGVDARWSPWDAPGSSDADLVVLRATWDYTERLEQFLAWVQQVPRLANPAAVVTWSTDKRYLLDLGAAGVPVVPTAVFGPGEVVELPAGEVVVKPSVGAGSHGAARFTDPAAAQAHASALHAAGRSVLVQPFEPSVDTAGETAMVVVRGRRSHAFGKAAMLVAPGVSAEVDASGLFHAEALSPRQPPGASWDLAERAVAVAAELRGVRPADLLYARVDTLGVDEPRVLELELVEPSLGWRQVPVPQRGAALTSFVEGVVALAGSTT